MIARSDTIKRLFLAVIIAVAIPVTAQNDPYARGQAALKRAEWLQAVEAFEQAAEANESQRDAALYWQAYALMKAGRDRQADRRIRQLEREYPDSKWLDDAQALTVNGESLGHEEGLDEEMRLYALSRLMERDPQRALPLLMDLVRKTESDRTRRDALFVLGMSDSNEARQAIGQIARDTQNPSLQIQAIHALGVADGEEAIALMRALFDETRDTGVQMAIVQASIPADADELLLEIVQRSDNPSVQNAAIQALGAMDATAALRGLYGSIKDKGSRIAVLQAMAIADDTEGLARAIREESDPDVRVMAIRNLGLSGNDAAIEMLREVYANPGSPQDREAVIEGLIMLGDDAESLALDIARTETDPVLQKRVIQVLGIIDATDALRSMYANVNESEQRRAILHSLAIAGDSDGLFEILRTERDPEVRIAALESLAILGDADGAGELLIELYPEAEGREREAILNALMIMGDAEALIALMRAEPDRERKQRILQVLAIMDDEAATDYLFEMMEGEAGED